MKNLLTPGLDNTHVPINIIPALETRSHRGVPVEEDPKSYDAAVVQVSILV